MLTVGQAAASAASVVRPRLHDVPMHFYLQMAVACAAIAFAGFTPTYWAPVATGSFVGSRVLHVHGLLFFAWTVLFIVQSRFAANGRFEHHRALGLAGVSLATAMLFAGLLVSITSMNDGIARGFERQARAFSIVPITIVLCFAAAVAGAIANTRRPDVHMRLMLVATITLLPPAVARILFFFLSPPNSPRPGLGEPPAVIFSLVPSLAADLLLIVATAYDWRTRGRPHRIYVISGLLLLAVQILRVPVSSTPAWHAVTDWLLAFLR